jgi:hypothetical protein
MSQEDVTFDPESVSKMGNSARFDRDFDISTGNDKPQAVHSVPLERFNHFATKAAGSYVRLVFHGWRVSMLPEERHTLCQQGGVYQADGGSRSGD